MALHELQFLSHNGRDQIHAWVYTPTTPPKAVVQVVHGLGEHSRRYLHLIATLVDAGFVVAADDHAGHGKTAMVSGIWADTGENGADVVVEDERTLMAKVREQFPDLPYVVYGHSWGSMIARGVAARYGADLAGLALGGIAAQMRGFEHTLDRDALAAALASGDGAAPGDPVFVGQMFDGFVDRCGPDAGPTAWVARNEAVVADHGIDPFNNFGAPMSLRFINDFVALYDSTNSDDWYAAVPTDLPVLIMAGDQDPVANFGEGAYHVANRLRSTGHDDVRCRVYTGFRHEVHNEPETRADVEHELVEFAGRVSE